MVLGLPALNPNLKLFWTSSLALSILHASH